jgi:hypothetical protein
MSSVPPGDPGHFCAVSTASLSRPMPNAVAQVNGPAGSTGFICADGQVTTSIKPWRAFAQVIPYSVSPSIPRAPIDSTGTMLPGVVEGLVAPTSGIYQFHPGTPSRVISGALAAAVAPATSNNILILWFLDMMGWYTELCPFKGVASTMTDCG